MADPATAAQNRLLAGIPEDELIRLAPDLELIRHELKECIYREDEPIERVIFPTTTVMSLISQMNDGRGIEIATIGNEGMVGLPVFLQATTTSAHRAFSQVPGESLQISAPRFREFVHGSPDGGLSTILQRYTLALMSMIARAVACNAVHSLQQRACRWLLQTHDRVQGDEFLLTQEFLGQMLGVTRPSVSEVSRQLQDAGAISYTRGHLTVLDRSALESRSCDCYHVIRAEFDRLLGSTP